MKNLLRLSFALICAAALAVSCSKSNGYTVTDHTVGMIKTRSWSGSAYGFAKGDTIQFPPPDTAHVAWPKVFYRLINDSSFAVIKINGFDVSAIGQWFNYKITDSVAKTVEFDTTLAGSSKSRLIYYFDRDSITIEYHIITGYNAAQNEYYQVNEYLHTNPQ